MDERILLFSVLSLVIITYSNASLVRQTTNGPVEGVEQISLLGRNYYAFKGIPYAEAPITGNDPYTGEHVDRRFKPPVPLNRTWSENLKVHEYADSCIISTYSNDNEKKLLPGSNTSENCLFLNIYVSENGASKKTVMVFIHGGGFNEGDARDSIYGPDFLLSEDNIVVTLAYRLGIFGFLNLGLDSYSGNMGLKDQQLTLKWIHENIENFSGNKNEILLLGESAGSASVAFHLLNEKSRGYFNRAYLSSSLAFSYYALHRTNHLQRMKDFVKINGTEELITYLKTADSEFLSKKYPFDFRKTLLVPWGPTIESVHAFDAFITESPEELYNSDKVRAIDTMFSFNSEESLTFRPEILEKTEPLISENLLESDVYLPFEGFSRINYPNEYKKSLEILKEAYYPNITNTSLVKRGNIDLMSELILSDSIIKAVILQANVNNKNVNGSGRKNSYLFRFSMNSDINYAKAQIHIQYDGAAHVDDLCYYFHCHLLDEQRLYDRHLERKDRIYDSIMRMMKILTNFARTGNPSLEGDTPFETCKSSNEVFCQEIGNNRKSKVTTNIKHQLHYDTWREVEKIYKNLQIV